MHSLTTKILKFEADEKNRSVADPCQRVEPFRLTPAKIGTRFKDTRGIIGDMGCGFQQLCGGNLRMKFHYFSADWRARHLVFEKCEISPDNGEAVTYEVIFKKDEDERNYVTSIRQHFDTYLSCPEAEKYQKAEALYASFIVVAETCSGIVKKRKLLPSWDGRNNDFAISSHNLYAEETTHFETREEVGSKRIIKD